MEGEKWSVVVPKKVNSKQKGAAFERRVCRALSLWVSKGKAEDLFWRSAMSGGRATVMYKKNKSASSQAGDISSVAVEGHVLTDRFSIECKNYEDLHLHNLVYGGKGGVVDFWKQATTDAHRNQKEPMLIAKQKRKPEIICLPTDGWPPGLSVGIWPKLTVPGHNMAIYLFKDFLDNARIE